MTKIRNKFLTATFLLALGGLQAATAAIITDSLGNTAHGFSDGDTPAAFLVGIAQGGQPAPFDTSYGIDIGGLFDPPATDFSATWTHSLGGAIVDPILSASLTIGIYDHDSAASGSQLLSFGIDGNDLTATLNSLFETGGGAVDSQYKEYTVGLDAIFGDLSDGIVDISLALQGLGLSPPCLFGPCPPTNETANNGANLIFSTLTIETRDISVIPIPAAAPLFASALVLMGLYRRRVLRNAA